VALKWRLSATSSCKWGHYRRDADRDGRPRASHLGPSERRRQWGYITNHKITLVAELAAYLLCDGVRNGISVGWGVMSCLPICSLLPICFGFYITLIPR
jgi:hypothetical protein